MKGVWLRTALFEATAYAVSTCTLAEVRGWDLTSVTRSCEVHVQAVLVTTSQTTRRAAACRAHLQSGLAVGHGGRAQSTHHNRHVEAVAGQSSSSSCYTEGLSQRVPGLLAEDGIDQLDDLVLWGQDESFFRHLTSYSIRIRSASVHQWSSMNQQERNTNYELKETKSSSSQILAQRHECSSNDVHTSMLFTLHQFYL